MEDVWFNDKLKIIHVHEIASDIRLLELSDYNFRLDYLTKYDADNEFPDCGQCDHVCDNEDIFCKICGPECGWHNYVRTDHYIIDDQEKIKKLLR